MQEIFKVKAVIINDEDQNRRQEIIYLKKDYTSREAAESDVPEYAARLKEECRTHIGSKFDNYYFTVETFKKYVGEPVAAG